MSTISEDEIRERAHKIWMEEGCPHGRDLEHWEQARQQEWRLRYRCLRTTRSSI
jgi:hypothetical protein